MTDQPQEIEKFIDQCPDCRQRFVSLDSPLDAEAKVLIHIDQEHTFPADCPLCGLTLKSHNQETVNLLITAHIKNDHFVSECPYCGMVATDADSKVNSDAEIVNHVIEHHPGILTDG